ncbi:uncharacterized protein YjbI with pentapeptide repeats [Comamonas sp. BIGb0152]|uniref:pentapeptide repeat-containing protein n=1 Tax=Comamonas sp. BIGb0152 TaxID=2940601 RepID=UPI002169FAD3|nr:pentapeptide repeat-containing protein [Comamonas sp. BIGb0152]MCS4294554.1 uncharacterized protein YjbI with pentapeptide repeats [Comamonas sp. BIGb0152]
MIAINQNEFLDKKRWLNISNYIYKNVDIQNINLIKVKFPMFSIETAKLSNCSFAGQEVMFDRIVDCDISNCKFSDINLNKTSVLGVNFVDCQFSDIDSYDLDISDDVLFENCSFKNVKITVSYVVADFKNCEFENVTFSEVYIKKETTSLGIRIKNAQLYRV